MKLLNTIGISPNSTKLDNLSSPDDNTDLNVSTSAHGLCPKLDNNASHYLNGQGGWTSPGGADTNAERVFYFPAGSFKYPASNPAPLDTDTGANGRIKRQLFDDTTEEYILQDFIVPSDITSGTVTFETYGYAVTADGNEIQFTFHHSAKTSNESWDAAYSEVDSGDKTTDSDQDDFDHFTWTETVANLGWVANDNVRFMLSRCAVDDGTTVSGDYGVVLFAIRIPRA
ncbi:MAG: hypothetical protein ACFFG0_14185 [Candidatus Thorarchaeota archaeon]